MCLPLRTLLLSAFCVFAGPTCADTLFVAKDGHDDAIGTRDLPLATVGAALERVRSDGTVVVRAGTFREALPDLAKPITLRAAPGEEVWLKGSVVVSRWQRDNDGWHADWTHASCADCFDPRNIEPDHPVAGLPDQLFVDGKPLRQVATRTDLAHDAFFIDRKNALIWIGFDPADRLMEGVVHSTALRIWKGAEGSNIRGLSFAHYAPTAEPGLGGMVKADADDLTFEDNTFAFSAVKGLSIYGRRATVRNNRFVDNGMMGLEAYKADGLVVAGNTFSGNNRERFVQTGVVSEAAGAKIVTSHDVIVENNVFASNRGNGLWFDIDVIGAIVTNNTFIRNARHGLFFEISSRARIEGNAMTANGEAGIALADATRVEIRDNTITANGYALVVQDDERTNTDAEAAAAGSTHVSAGNTFVANRVEGAGANPLIWIRDYTARLDPAAMIELRANDYDPRPGQPLLERWRNGVPDVLTDESALKDAGLD